MLASTKILSIQQPWAWLILHAGKDIENRTWSTKNRGRVLVHASKGMTNESYLIACHAAHQIDPSIKVPGRSELEYGGIVGSVNIVDCVTQSDSLWFFGPKGFVLRDPKPLPFTPLKGKLGFFAHEEGYE
jgi:hypothetical protein